MNKIKNTSKKNKIPKQGIELLLIIVFSLIVFFIAAHFDILEHFIKYSRAHESWELDELLIVFIFVAFALTIFTMRRMREFFKSEKILKEKNKRLGDALSEIKQLKGIIPICASCKMIRDDKGYWHQVEVYVHEHTEADFSHGLCPDCAQKLYPEQFSKKEKPETQSE